MQRNEIAFTICLGLALTLLSSSALGQYQLTNLDSNQAKTARFIDPLQVNGWGIARTAGGPWWVSDEGSGWSTLYNGEGAKQGLIVSVPSFNGAGPGQPDGNCLQRNGRISGPGKLRVLHFRDNGWDHQRMGSIVQPQCFDYRGE
jgi:hypothetical protein